MVTRWGGRWGRAALMAAMGVVMVVVLGPDVLKAVGPDESDHGTATSDHPMIAPLNPPAVPAYGQLAQALTKARSATVRYATGLRAAQADGYKVITPMMAEMGVHYLNPDVTGFDLEKPMILVYAGKDGATQLVALEWVFPKVPDTQPIPGATYGSFDAACHYIDGQFIPGPEASCTLNHPASGAPFFFWHPDLVTLHVWLWHPNPAGIFNDTNPLIAPYN
jgi:hypothetical protein